MKKEEGREGDSNSASVWHIGNRRLYEIFEQVVFVLKIYYHFRYNLINRGQNVPISYNSANILSHLHN
jgi:hypothetical protein